MRVVVTGGGTGGHIFPGIAVAEELRQRDPGGEILFVGGAKGLEATLVPAAGFRFAAVPARGLLGKGLLRLPGIFWTTLRGLFASYRVLAEFDPDVVFATGGYVSGAVALAGRIRGTPLVLHEQNSVPGLTNRLLSRVAQEVHLNLSTARRHFPRRRHLKLTGSPIRRGTLDGDPQRALREFGLQAGKQTVLFLGGSQGARSINRAAVGAVRALRRRDNLQFILQTGRRDFARTQSRLRSAKTIACVRPFIEKMGDAYALADLVVARAGAMTLAEITSCGKASILIPYPHATHQHQEANAHALVAVGAAERIADRSLKGENLAATIGKLIDTPRKLRDMSNNALSLARPDAAAKIAVALLAYGRENGAPEGDKPAEAGTTTRRRKTRSRSTGTKPGAKERRPRTGRRKGSRNR